jgi:hypothetical protein
LLLSIRTVPAPVGGAQQKQDGGFFIDVDPIKKQKSARIQRGYLAMILCTSRVSAMA